MSGTYDCIRLIQSFDYSWALYLFLFFFLVLPHSYVIYRRYRQPHTPIHAMELGGVRGPTEAQGGSTSRDDGDDNDDDANDVIEDEDDDEFFDCRDDPDDDDDDDDKDETMVKAEL